MKKSKQHEDKLLLREERQLTLFSKYGTVDRDNKVVNVNLHYESIDDLLEHDLSTEDKPAISTECIEKAVDIMDKLPASYGAGFNVTVDDFKGYEPNKVMESFNDSMELEHYRTFKQGRKGWYIAAILALLGVVSLIILMTLKTTGVLGGETMEDQIIDYFIDTVACVLVWESFSMLFLYPADFYVRNNKAIIKFKNLALFNSKGELLCQENKSEMMKEWVEETGKKKTGKAMLLISGTALIAVALMTLVSLIVGVVKTDLSKASPSVIATLIVTGVNDVFAIFAGFGAWNLVREKGRFRLLTIVFAYILCCLYLADIILVVYSIATSVEKISPGHIVGSGLGLIISIMLIVGYYLSKMKDRKHSEFNNKSL